MASDGFATTRIAKEIGVSPATVTRWRECFEEEGLKASVKVRPGRGRKPSIGPEKVQEIVHATLHETPPGETHWSCRSMARAHGVSHTTVQKIWAARGLKPHRVETFKLSKDPRFEEKLADVVGLYLNPPERAIVLSMDEKSQIQALDRTQPSLPMKPGRAGTMTHDYKRNGNDDHAVRRARCPDRFGDRPMPAPPPPHRVPHVPAHDRPPGPQGPADPSDPR